MPPFTEERWSGDEKLVIGIDIGTTQMAFSYIHLYSGTYLINPLLRKSRHCSRWFTSSDEGIKLAWTVQPTWLLEDTKHHLS